MVFSMGERQDLRKDAAQVKGLRRPELHFMG